MTVSVLLLQYSVMGIVIPGGQSAGDAFNKRLVPQGLSLQMKMNTQGALVQAFRFKPA